VELSSWQNLRVAPRLVRRCRKSRAHFLKNWSGATVLSTPGFALVVASEINFHSTQQQETRHQFVTKNKLFSGCFEVCSLRKSKTFGSAGLRKFFYLVQIKHWCLKLNAIHFRGSNGIPMPQQRHLRRDGSLGPLLRGRSCGPKFILFVGTRIASKSPDMTTSRMPRMHT
jgi:hypothetical protein